MMTEDASSRTSPGLMLSDARGIMPSGWERLVIGTGWGNEKGRATPKDDAASLGRKFTERQLPLGALSGLGRAGARNYEAPSGAKTHFVSPPHTHFQKK